MSNAKQDFSFVDELERLLPEMRAFARSLCKDPILADDLVQDTCLKAWSAVDKFNPDNEMRPWLFTILRNEFYQHTRRAWRSTELEPDQAERSLVSNECLEAKSDFRVMQAAIDALPAGQKEALILVVAAGFTYEEAGKICNCSDGTVKSRVSRARETVMHAMAQADSGNAKVSSSGKTLDALLAEIDALQLLQSGETRTKAA